MSRSAFSRVAFLCLCTFLAAPAAAALVVTQVNVGDCVADRVSIPYAPERQPFDEQYCRRWNASDKAAYEVCLHNSSLNDTPFFTDRCGDGTEFYFAIDGVEHVLHRVGPRWLQVNLSGRFAGDGLELEVLPLKQWTGPASGATPEGIDDEDAESGSWSVQVTVRKGGDTRTFEATLVYGP